MRDSLSTRTRFRGEIMTRRKAINQMIDQYGFRYVIFTPAKTTLNFYLAANDNPSDDERSAIMRTPREMTYIDEKLKNKGGPIVVRMESYSKLKAQQGQVIEGPSHDSGGVDVVDKNSGKPIIEAEGGEIIINAQASRKHCKKLSELNQSAGNGIAFDCDKTGPEAQTDKAEHGAVANPSLQVGGNAQAVVPQSDLHKTEYTGKAEAKRGSKVGATPEIPKSLHNIMPVHQQKFILQSEEDFSPTLADLEAIVAKLPKLYAQDGKGGEVIAYLHYFYGPNDWYITEYDRAENLFFGFANLGDPVNAEFGYINPQELISSNKVELDFHFNPTKFSDLPVEGNPYYNEPKKKIEVATVEHLDLDSPEEKIEGDAAFNRKAEKLIDEKGINPEAYTSEDKELLRTYTGWGGLDIEGTGKGKEALTEFYTPDAIIRKMWALAYKYGFQNGGSVLEPACGIGDFLKYVPSSSTARGIEMSKYSSTIAKILYPQYEILNLQFEQLFIKDRDSVRSRIANIPNYDLVIGNPPYGDVGGLYMGMGEKQYTKAKNWIEYFITRGLDLTKSGGLLIYIIGTEVANGGVPWLAQGPSKVKDEISSKADLLDAYRLPNGVFDRTDVVSDIVVFKKK